MKTKLFLIPAVVAILVVTSCRKDNETSNPSCLLEQGCNTYGTIRNTTCGQGAWGNLWIQLDNGEYLQPWEVAYPSNGIPLLFDGQRIKFGHKLTKRDNRYDSTFICLAVVPYSTPVIITCLEPEKKTCNVLATVVRGLPSKCGLVLKINSSGEQIYPDNNINSSLQLQEGTMVKISYTLRFCDCPVHCDTFACPATIECIETVVDCGND